MSFHVDFEFEFACFECFFVQFSGAKFHGHNGSTRRLKRGWIFQIGRSHFVGRSDQFTIGIRLFWTDYSSYRMLSLYTLA